MSSQRRITEVTRRRLAEALNLAGFKWAGHLEEPVFLSRLYDLSALPSDDPRFSGAAQDIYQHRINNYDWDDDWIFQDPRFRLADGPDETLLAFLAESLHPAVQTDSAEVQQTLAAINALLAPDGYELAQASTISGLPVFKGRRRSGRHLTHAALQLEQRPLLTEHGVLQEHLERIRGTVDTDPPTAIAACKELLESLCKIILNQTSQPYSNADDLPALNRKVCDVLQLNAKKIPDDAPASDTVKKILRTLTTTVQSLCELRNELGLGHGRIAPSTAYARHATLAFNSAVAVAEFLIDTLHDRAERGLLEHPNKPSSTGISEQHSLTTASDNL